MQRQKVLWSTTALIILALPALAWVAPRTRTKDSSAAKELSAKPYARRAKAAVARHPASPPIGDSENQKLEVEQITLRSNGFNPTEVTRPQGRFILSVHNRSGLDNIELQFGRENGSRVQALQSRKRKLSWSEEVDLPPGRYLLSVNNRPEWKCLITITAR